MSRKLADYFYDLPEELIAQTPIYPRDTSRLMVLNKNSGQIDHRIFTDIVQYLDQGDLLVVNDTKVIPARLHGVKAASGGKVEILLLRPVKQGVWESLVRPARRLKIGDKLQFGDGVLQSEIVAELPEGIRHIRFADNPDEDFESIIDRIGEMPLPPYIKEKLSDKDRYQTVYAQKRGSAAAPTAGLHFTPELLKAIEVQGVNIARLTLHVGIGTFRPVQVENIAKHQMHSEFYHVDPSTASLLNQTRIKGKRIIAVGTTSVRALESLPLENGRFLEASGFTDKFIYPGYKFQAVDGLITNFHLPKSSLLMLVSALAGRENILNAYHAAVQERYRFFSFGDAMLLI